MWKLSGLGQVVHVLFLFHSTPLTDMKKFKTVRVLSDSSLQLVQKTIDEMVDAMPDTTTGPAKTKAMLDLTDEWKKQVCVPGYKGYIFFPEEMKIFSAVEQQLEVADFTTLSGQPVVVYNGDTVPLSSLRFLYVQDIWKYLDGSTLNEGLEDFDVPADVEDTEH